MQEFLKAKPLAQTLGVGVSTLKQWRKDDRLIEGVRFVRYSYNLLLYNVAMMINYIATRSDPQLHERQIQDYLKQLEKTTQKKRG